MALTRAERPDRLRVMRKFRCRMIFSANRFPPRITSGAGFFGIMR